MKIKSIVMLSLTAVAMSLTAMPTKQELKQVEGLVQELMRPELDAFKAGTKTRADVAKSAIALAEKAESDAAKMLLLKGSFTFYVGHGAFDEAIGALKTLKTTIPDIPPEYMANMIESALRNVPKSKGGLIYRLLDDTKSYVRHQDELKNALAKSKKRPGDRTLHLRIAELYAILGDWDKALDEFVKGDNPKAAEVAKAEKGEGKMPKNAIAEFWWSYPVNGDEEQQKKFKRHAAAIYAEAINSGDANGLVKVKAQRRIDEVKGYGDDMLAGVITRPASEVTGTSHPSAGNLYCVIDLSAGPNATNYPVSYLTTEPKGGWTDEYKTTKLVLRRIEPGTFIMGENQKDESRRVKIAKPFYIGVFQVTQKQYELVTGGNPTPDKGDMRPVGAVPFNILRGDANVYNWPESDAVDAKSFIGRIRARTGMKFDLPTEKEWEYACRAGTTSKFNNGGNSAEDAVKVGRVLLNQAGRGDGWLEPDDLFGKHKPDDRGGRHLYATNVGMYIPNSYGLYDMHGNIWEWTLGSRGGTAKVLRGGSWTCPLDMCSSTGYITIEPWDPKFDFGFRLFMPATGQSSGSDRR